MKTGETIGWVVIDEQGVPVSFHVTRSEAREYAKGAGRIARLVVAK